MFWCCLKNRKSLRNDVSNLDSVLTRLGHILWCSIVTPSFNFPFIDEFPNKVFAPNTLSLKLFFRKFTRILFVVSTPPKNISQLGWLFPTYGKIKVMFQSPPIRYSWIKNSGWIGWNNSNPHDSEWLTQTTGPLWFPAWAPWAPWAPWASAWAAWAAWAGSELALPWGPALSDTS